MAKDLVRTRRYVRKFILMKANIQAVSLKIQTLKSQNTMAQAMKGVTRALATMNRQLNMPQIQKILQVCSFMFFIFLKNITLLLKVLFEASVNKMNKKKICMKYDSSKSPTTELHKIFHLGYLVYMYVTY